MFPWDLLKAETLRTLCRDLGYPKYTKRDAMIGFLEKVSDQGLERVLEADSTLITPTKRQTNPSPSTTPSKRKQGAVVSNYNTRHKRVRVSDPPIRSFRSKTSKKDGVPPRRPGRPLKTALKSTPKANTTRSLSASASPRHEVFDGVVVLPAVYLPKWKGKVTEEDIEDDDIDGEGEDDPEVYLPEDDDLMPRPESSLASSNKENEMVYEEVEAETHATTEEGAAESGPSTRVLTNTVVNSTQIAEEGEGDDIDAEGEVVAELDESLSPIATYSHHFFPETRPESGLGSRDKTSSI